MSPSAKVFALRQAFPPTSKGTPIVCIECGEGSAWRGVDLSMVKLDVPLLGLNKDGTATTVIGSQVEYRHHNRAVCQAIKQTRKAKTSVATRLNEAGLVAVPKGDPS
jgi:hypothetical protein